ncbi:MAG: ABC transporter substrate-binding protein [Prevotella sp.]|jgi:NitT/TauT family transport system substrate-binding protein
MRRSFSFIIFFVSLLLLSACGESRQARLARTRAEYEKQVRENRAALKIGVLPTMDCLPLFIAEDDSLFQATGSDIRLKMRNAQLDNDTAFIGGSLEGMVTDLRRLKVIEKKGIGVVIAVNTNSYWQLFGNPKARIFELKQLGNKMVAMTRYSATDYLTDVALKGVKTQGAVFRVQFNDVKLRLRMLQNNEMDALWLTEPQATKARLLGANILFDSEKSGFHLGVIAFRKKACEDKKRQKQLGDFVKAYNQAVDSINVHGIQHYGKLIEKYCGCDSKTVKALPKLKYKHMPVHFYDK